MGRIRTLPSTDIASELVLTLNHIPQPTRCRFNSKFRRAFPLALFGPDKSYPEAEDPALRLQDLPRLRAGYFFGFVQQQPGKDLAPKSRASRGVIPIRWIDQHS